MSKTININLEEKLKEFPEELREIAEAMIKDLNKTNVSKATVESSVMMKINKLVTKEL
ncbi:MAG TPA: hypothetical protein VIM70_21090 [Clostridium sp.]|uniref:hypothetical protein n=1 Tax=Clostridium sp. TaxID=1506 RepID=UPI002F92A8B5